MSDPTTDLENLLSARPAEKGRDGRLSSGTVVGEWKVVAFVGAGRSAEVYRVTNVRMGGDGALKLLVDESYGLRERFRLEMDVVRTLSITALPRFFGSGEMLGCPYYVMEYLQPLLLPLRPQEIVPFVSALAAAVGELHAAGYVHRDLKPANVLRRRNGDPVLIDLGLVKPVASCRCHALSDRDESLSIVDGRRVGVGTPGFAAPEQLIKGEATIRSDVFALGKMLKACGGKGLGSSVRHVIRIATAEDPEDRYPDTEAFRSALVKDPLWLRVAVVAAIVCGLFIVLLQLPLSGFLRSNPSPKRLPPEPTQTSVSAQPVVSLEQQPDESDAAYLARLVARADAGDAAAQCAAAEAYFYGRGTAVDQAEAVRRYRLAAEANLAGAQVSLGNCLLRGLGCERSPDAAAAWLSRAAHQGNLGAMNDLAFCFHHGLGVDRDDAEAFRWAMKAAESGHAGAQTFVGECYLEGFGVERNQRRADDWLQRAARQGNERAKLLLRTR